MADKTVSKYLVNLEKQFAATDPVLQKAVKVFQELDELEFEMGLIENDESTARRSSWWPLITTVGGYSPAKSDFLNRFLGVTLHTTRHKFTVLQYTPQATSATLPGTALDADHRLPFYQISRDIEEASPGEGGKVNSYLELVTVNCAKLKNKLVIDSPVLNPAAENAVNGLLRQHVIAISDLVLVFTDLFEADPEFNKSTVDSIVQYQDTNKFLFVIDHSEIQIDEHKTHDIITSWQRRLAEFGIFTGHFVVLSQNSNNSEIEQRVNNLNHDRSYRVLDSLEKSIRAVDDVVMDEVESALTLWKERCNATTLIILSFIIMLILFAEIAVGILDLFFDPIIGPLIVLGLIAFLTPIHMLVSKVHAKFIINQLHKRQKKLNISEDLAGLFEKSLSFWRVILPITQPVGKTKKNRKKLSHMLEQTKDLVQALNDQFSRSQFQDYSPSYEPQSGEEY
ncbi:dynamin family protein [Methylomonas sp. SURF-2]|uniref:Dynamin family protein n=1 Tax=Methylomonas subterranea TaxID=2952225 RepID=A0ABT1TIR8_9GAMM|nr:dynamin family protein [Methylomonas sp. SURF-2]MCQ8105353.1 dynamin family protein [Methylomonas sp. SURF-2]